MKQNIAIRLAYGPWFVLSLVAGFVLLSPASAFAHPGHGQTNGFLGGVSHPLFGLDHICAMVAVGLWAAQRGGKALWVVPLAFVSVMAIGGMLGMATGTLPLVDRGIAASVLVLGVLVAAAVRLPLAASVAIVGLFALLHGHAHGAEMPATASAMAYGLGFITSTVLLHLSGIGLGLLSQRISRVQLVRFAGAAIALCGVFLLLA